MLKFQEKEIPINIPYILGNKNPKKLLIFQEMELLDLHLKNSYLGKWKFLIFLGSGTFLYFREMELSYISGNGTFLTFRKWKPQKSTLYFRERNFLYFRRNFQSSKNQNLLSFSRKSMNKFF